MSERHVELWGRVFGSREDFDPGSKPNGIDIIEVMRGHCKWVTKGGQGSSSKKDQAKLVAKKLKLLYNSRGEATIKEEYIVNKILSHYKDYLKLDQQGEQYRTQAWKDRTVRPFKDTFHKTFEVASKAGQARYLRKNPQKVKNYPF